MCIFFVPVIYVLMCMTMFNLHGVIYVVFLIALFLLLSVRFGSWYHAIFCNNKMISSVLWIFYPPRRAIVHEQYCVHF
jgi:hypothetical protein